MSIFKAPFFRTYLLPGFVFQSVIIAGGYGTGREIVEYFLEYGPLGGLVGMVLVTTVMWSLILAVSFEFARVFKAYDYRTFTKNLLGRYWVVFEALYIYTILVVLAVIGSAAGVLFRDNFGIPYAAGIVIMFTAIGFLTFKGSALIAKFLAGWSFLLYFVYLGILAAALIKFAPILQANLAAGEMLPGWFHGGFQYALYNFVVVPAVLFCLQHIETRKEAVTAGILGGVIGIIPGILFFIAVASQYPYVLPEEIPIMYLLDAAGFTPLTVLFLIVLFGTLIETGTGFIHAVNQRLEAAYLSRGKNFPREYRPVVAVAFLIVGLGVAQFGIIELVARGYGALSWGVFFVVIIPLFTIGIYKIRARSKSAASTLKIPNAH